MGSIDEKEKIMLLQRTRRIHHNYRHWWLPVGLLWLMIPVVVAQVTLTPLDDMAFGRIEFTQPVAGQVQLGTNGNISYAAAFSGSGSGQPGRIEIDVTAGTTVEISCDNQATLTDTSANTVTLNGEIALSPGTIPGSGSDCTGVGNVVITHTVSSGSAIVHVGGALNPASSLASGSYSTKNVSGAPLTVRVVVQ